MRILMSLLLLSIAKPLLAGPIGPGNFTYERVRDGSLLFPAAICPDVNHKYEEITDQLATLRAAIKKNAKCEDGEVKIDGLANLVDKGRGEFWQTIDQGRRRSLTKEETDKVTGYVSSVTQTGAAFTDLILGSSCFKDDQKNQMSVALVASLISESTAALATVTGPYGPLVGMGGKITSTLVTSIDQVVRSRQAYDFDDAEQRKTFLKTMCSYHGFRRELDEISRVDQAIDDMKKYQQVLVEQLKTTKIMCEECKTITDLYKAGSATGEEYLRKPTSELLVLFQDPVKAADARFYQPVGTQTVITMRAIVWAADELERLDALVSDLGDVERDRVVRTQDTIEDFLFVKWLPVFVRHYQSELDTRLSALRRKLNADLFRLGESDFSQTSETAGLVQKLFGPAPKDIPVITLPPTPPALDIYPSLYQDRTYPSEFKTIPQRDAYRKSAQVEINRMIGDTVSALLVLEKTCTFARASQSRFESALFRVCDLQSADVLDRAYSFLLEIGKTTHANSAFVKAAVEVPTPAFLAWADKNQYKPPVVHQWTANWIQSLTLQNELLKQMEKRFYELRP